VTERPTLDARWFPRRPRYQRSHVGRRVVYGERVVGTLDPDRKRLLCGFRDPAGNLTCTAPDLGAVTAWGGITLAPGMRRIGGLWQVAAPTIARDAAPWDDLGVAPPIALADLPLIARCRHGHLTKITAGVLACVRMLRPMT
jgi:hypothetical protein